MPDFNRDGLKAAAQSLARTMKKVAVVRTRRTADAVNVKAEGDAFLIRGGKPGGGWGWDPITALMFDDDKRHPFFGNRRRWYNQGYYGITENTVTSGIDEAADEYARNAIDPLLRDDGFDE